MRRLLIALSLVCASSALLAQPVGQGGVMAPPLNILPFATERVSGKWLLAIDAASLRKTIRPAGSCSEQQIPLDLGAAFSASLVTALRSNFEDLEETLPPVLEEEIKARKAKGVITVRANDIRARVMVEVGALMSHVSTQAVLATTVTVDIRSSRIIEALIDGQAAAQADTGGMCSGGTAVLTEVASSSVQDATRKISAMVGQSEYLRAER